jgi:signal transduction histidine kinase/CheY-like chemotaxis protein
MVQTHTGNVVVQNHAWQRCIQDLQDPETIRQQIADLFEKTRPLDQDAVPTIFCELGGSPHDCVCTCSTQDGQTKTWKFIKVPMPSLSEDLMPIAIDPKAVDQAVDQAIAQSSLASQSPASPSFKFAETLQTRPIANRSVSGDREGGQASPPLWVIIAQDLTVQYQTSASLSRQNEQLVEANRIRDDLLNYLTHELKTPLTAILGLSNLLKDQAIGGLNERQTQYASLLYKSGRQLASLVNNVLTLTLLENEDFQLHHEWSHLPLLCEQAYREALDSQCLTPPLLSSSYPVIISEQLTFDLDIQPNAHYGFVDPLRLKQILGQLLTNALKFSRLKGEITLRVRRCHQWLVFDVSDTGVGIPEKLQKHIFQTFYNFDDASERPAEGSGLGLVLVHRLVAAQNGIVSFLSQEDVGSQFTVLLPVLGALARAPEGHRAQGSPSFHQDGATVTQDIVTSEGKDNAESKESEPSIPSSSSLTNRIIVIVDHDPTTIAKLVQCFDAEGYQSVVARSKREAWRCIQMLHPCCVVMNFSLLDCSATDLFAQLRARPESQAVPVIALCEAVDIAKVRQMGIELHLTCPVNGDTLKQHLHSIDSQLAQSSAPAKPITVLFIKTDPNGGTTHNSQGSHYHSGSDPSSQADEPIAPASPPKSSPTPDLSAILHPYHCRVLEIDDISQADVLSRVWNPDVMMLSNQTSKPAEVLGILSQQPDLSTLPIITLTPEHTEIANQFRTLKVFPCLNFNLFDDEQFSTSSMIPPLVEVIRVAAGVQRVPRIAILPMMNAGLVDWSALEGSSRVGNPQDVTQDIIGQAQRKRPFMTADQHMTRLDVFVKYCQMAGVHSTIQWSLAELVDFMAQQPLDGVLIYESFARESGELPSVSVVKTLRTLDHTLSTIIWLDDDRWSNQPLMNVDHGAQFRTLDAEVILGARPMHEVVAMIQMAIANRLE